MEPVVDMPGLTRSETLVRPPQSRSVAVLQGVGPRAVVAAVLLAGVMAIIIARWLTGTGFRPALAGLPDPGALTAFGLVAAQYVHELAGVAVVGLLVCRGAVLEGGVGAGRRHLGAMAVRWGWAWVVSTVVWILFTVSDLTGAPVSALADQPDVIRVVVGTDRVLAEIATLWVALLIAMFGGRLADRRSTRAALVLAVAALLPSALAGHAGHHSSPVLAMVALGVHLVAAAIWVGGLLALVVHLRPFPDQLRQAVPRFSRIALACVLAVGISGVLEAAVMLEGWSALWGSDRGHLIVAKTVALVLLASAGYGHRRRTVGPACSGRLLPLLRLAAGELIVMGATIGVAVALSTTA